MSIAEKKVYCPCCGKFVDSERKRMVETLPVKGVEISFETDVRCCVDCGEKIFDRDLDNETMKKAYHLYREKMGLLQPNEIRSVREKYGLNQVAFARVLGLGDKTISRYENGSLQDEAQNNLILLVREVANFQTLFDKNKDRLTKEDQEKVEKVFIHFDECEAYTDSLTTEVPYSSFSTANKIPDIIIHGHHTESVQMMQREYKQRRNNLTSLRIVRPDSAA